MPHASDPDDLARFVRAQEGVYEQALSEIRRGHKRTHWMWFVFPQLDGLGYPTTRLCDQEPWEARAYWRIGARPRLQECVHGCLHSGQIVGFSFPDDLKRFADALRGQCHPRFDLGACSISSRTDPSGHTNLVATRLGGGDQGGPGLDEWLSVARSADATDLREHILSGHKDGKPFTPYVPTIELPAPLDRVLDFGCGLGRNFPYVKEIALHVTGFDLPPMIERCRSLATERVDVLADDWQQVRASRFDLIFASLVLQHIEPAICSSYLTDFAQMAPRVYLLTRLDNDFGPNVLDLVARVGQFEASECIHVDHDPVTNQLRVLGRGSFDDVRQPRAKHREPLSRLGDQQNTMAIRTVRNARAREEGSSAPCAPPPRARRAIRA